MITLCQLKGTQSQSLQNKVKRNKLCITWGTESDAVVLRHHTVKSQLAVNGAKPGLYITALVQCWKHHTSELQATDLFTFAYQRLRAQIATQHSSRCG